MIIVKKKMNEMRYYILIDKIIYEFNIYII